MRAWRNRCRSHRRELHDRLGVWTGRWMEQKCAARCILLVQCELSPFFSLPDCGYGLHTCWIRRSAVKQWLVSEISSINLFPLLALPGTLLHQFLHVDPFEEIARSGSKAKLMADKI